MSARWNTNRNRSAHDRAAELAGLLEWSSRRAPEPEPEPEPYVLEAPDHLSRSLLRLQPVDRAATYTGHVCPVSAAAPATYTGRMS